MSAIVIAYAIYDLLFVIPIYGTYFNKGSMNNAYGMIYAVLTILIVVGVPLFDLVLGKIRK